MKSNRMCLNMPRGPQIVTLQWILIFSLSYCIALSESVLLLSRRRSSPPFYSPVNICMLCSCLARALFAARLHFRINFLRQHLQISAPQQKVLA